MSDTPKGFAALSPEKRKELASKGGKAVHRNGTAHEWNSEEAREAGRKGGLKSKGGRRAVLDRQVEGGVQPKPLEGDGDGEVR